MKLTYEDKIEIYQLRKQGESLKKLSQKYDIGVSNIKYLVRLIDRYGTGSVKKKKIAKGSLPNSVDKTIFSEGTKQRQDA